MAEDKPLKPVPITFSGKWRPAIDGTMMGDGDLQTLTNMRYTDAPGIKSVCGMTKINTSAPATYIKFKSGYHFKKSHLGYSENHVLVQAANAGDTLSRVIHNTTAAPAQGNFSSDVIWSDSTGYGTGHFSPVPDGCIGYTNGVDSCVWSGDYGRVGSLINGDATGTVAFLYDYTHQVNGNFTDAQNKVTLYSSDAGAHYYLWLGAVRPIKGIRVTVETVNTAAATVGVQYYTSSGLTSVSTLTDGTILTAGKSLTQTGEIGFDSTVATAVPTVKFEQYLYWYLFTFGPLSAGTIISKVATIAPFQTVKDIWDGTPRAIQDFELHYATGSYLNGTVPLLQQDYDSGVFTTYSDISNLPGAGVSDLLVGFATQMTAIYFGLVPSSANTNAATMTIKYWDGDSWVSVTVTDQTIGVATKTLSQSGWVSWTAPAITAEFKQSINGGSFLYYYQITFSAALATSYIDYMSGIPAPTPMPAYKMVTTWQNRMVLIGAMSGQKNSMIIGKYGSSCSFNGPDSRAITDIGDESLPTAVGPLFTRDSGYFYDTLIICKQSEVWVLDGTGVDNYRLYKLSDKYGCVAPESFQICPVSYEIAGGINRHIAIWQTATGIVMFDGNTINPIDLDIRNYFDPNHADCITSTLIDKSISFVDEREREYHIIIASGSGATALNTELVYSTKRKAWFVISRPIILQGGIVVTDSYGGRYVYGLSTTGYLYRLENGNTFDGTSITSTVKTKDYTGGWTYELESRHVKLMAKSKGSSTATVTLSAFLDTKTAAESKTMSLALASSTKRVVQTTQSPGWAPATFCAFQCQVVSSDVIPAFEPIGIALLAKAIREDLRPLVS